VRYGVLYLTDAMAALAAMGSPKPSTTNVIPLHR
jgi:hypothetical protein